MLVQIGTTNLSKYIESGAYDVNDVDQYEEWQDGNLTKHREYFRKSVKGSFNVICSSKTITVGDLVELLENNTSNNKLTILLWIENKGKTEAINCYYTTKAKHSPNSDIVTIAVEEC